MATRQARPKADLEHEARTVLRFTQKDLAEALGVSERTGQRWSAGGGVPSHYLPELARLVHRVDARLAAEIAATCGQTLGTLGLEAPPTAPGATVTAGPPSKALADSVVCAAARAANVPPAVQEAPTLAAFERAKELGMSLDDVIAALSPTPSKRRAAPPTT